MTRQETNSQNGTTESGDRSDSRMSTYAVGLVDGGLGRELVRLRHVAVQKTIRIEGNWEDHQ